MIYLGTTFFEHHSGLSAFAMTDIYLSRYLCRRWWGQVSALQMMHVPADAEVLPALQEHAMAASGSQTCSVELLQKFQLSLKVVETYSNLATLPVSRLDE